MEFQLDTGGKLKQKMVTTALVWTFTNGITIARLAAECKVQFACGGTVNLLKMPQ